MKNKKPKNLVKPLLFLSSIACIIGLFGSSAVAANVGLVHVSGPNDGDTTSTSISGDGNTNVLNAWQLDVSTFPPACTLSDVNSMTVTSSYSKSQSPSSEINPSQDGGFIFVGESSGGSWTPWGTISSPSGEIMGSPYTGGISRDYTIWGGATVTTIPISIGGIWSSSVAPTANFVIAVMTDTTNTGYDHNISGATVTISKPVVNIDFSSCVETNTVPTITPPSSTTIPSATASGSTVVPGSSLGATDLDGDKLTYSITAGNTGNYFAIDSSTGNITTTSSNIPAGTYKLSVQVDDGKDGKTTAEVVIVVAASTAANLTTSTPTTATASSTEVLAKTGEDVRLVVGGGMLVLMIGSYLIFKLRSAKMQY
jgi:hypothetical protein